MTTIDYRAAATAARQIVKPYIALQALQPVLDQLAGEDASIAQLRQQLVSLQAQEGEARARFVEADAKAHAAAARAEELFAEQVGIQQGRLDELKAGVRALEQRHVELTRDVQALDQERTEIRERLRTAVA